MKIEYDVIEMPLVSSMVAACAVVVVGVMLVWGVLYLLCNLL